MKKLLHLGIVFFLISCSGSTKKPASEEISFMLNGEIKCEVYQVTELFSRVVTFEQIDENDLKTVVDSLMLRTDIVYFHIPELMGRGEEYGSIVGDFATVFPDFDRDKLIAEKIGKEIKNINRANDEKFADKAFIISKEFVKSRLVSPKSADFPFSDYKYSNVVDNTISLESYVDAKNSYNAEIRHNYRIKLKLVGSDWTSSSNWKLISLDFY